MQSRGDDARKLILLKGGCEDSEWLGKNYLYKYEVTGGSVSVDAGFEWSYR